MTFTGDTKTRAEQIYLSVLWGCLLIPYLIGVYFYLGRRHRFDLIAARAPVLTTVLLCVIGANVFITFVVEMWFPHAGCDTPAIYSLTSITYVNIFSRTFHRFDRLQPLVLPARI